MCIYIYIIRCIYIIILYNIILFVVTELWKEFQNELWKQLWKDFWKDFCRSLTALAASGTLGILIPPSIMLVIMSDQLAISLGDLFMGALFPGLLLGALYITFIVVYGLISPKSMPVPADREPVTMAIVLEVLLSVLP